MRLKIFIVEDDAWFGGLLRHHLSLNPDYTVTIFTTGRECLASMHQKPDVVCVDYGLPDMTGDILLQKIKEVNQGIPVIVISAQEDLSVAVNFFRLGATDYLIKGENTKDHLWNALLKLGENKALREEVEELKEQLGQKFNFGQLLVGDSPSLKKVFTLIDKAIHSNINVSITGETGTGKEVVAKTIHYNSDRSKQPFVAVNMAAIPSELMESELFGYEKGAFTGADTRKAGKFEEAKKGTIFLDEIAELDLNLQSKILRVLQEREITRLGGHEKIKIEARLITATHKNLSEEVRKKTFREDLYYRVMGLPIELPPLRDRDNDVLILAKHFIDAYCKENKIKVPQLSPDARKKLLQYHYPGNVRELKAITDLACVMSNGKEILADDIQFNSVKPDELFTVYEKSLKEYTADIIQFYLKKYNNNVMEVAKRLDVGRSTIYDMLRKMESNRSGETNP